MITSDVQPYRRYRVTLLRDVEEADDAAIERGDYDLLEKRSGLQFFKVPKRVTPAGTVYEGVASDVDAHGFFDLNLDDGQAIGFCTQDDGILIVAL